MILLTISVVREEVVGRDIEDKEIGAEVKEAEFEASEVKVDSTETLGIDDTEELGILLN